ncbi:MAG: DNA polymerase III subunit beta [Armatimonadota bacterium]
MKLNVLKSKIEEGILKVSKAVSHRSPLPILTHILFKTDGNNSIKLLATDLEVGIETSVETQVLKKGSFCAPAKIITEIITQLPDEDIVFELKDKVLEIRAHNSKYNINVLDEEDFPVFPKSKNIPTLNLNQGIFKDIIKNVIFACAQTEEIRTTLTGVLFNLKGQVLTVVSTDGRRLAKAEYPLKEVFSKEEKFIIPSKSLQEIQRLLKEEGDLFVFINEGQIFFKFDETTIYSRTIEGNFPNYNQVIPSKHNIEAEVKREDLLHSIKRALILACEKDSPKLVKIGMGKEKIIITSATADLGNAYEEVDIINKKGGDIKISFNGKYIVDFLSNFGDEKIALCFTHTEGPAVMKLKEREDYIYIIMPVKVREEEEKKEETEEAEAAV